jgi:hypothetical protein
MEKAKDKIKDVEIETKLSIHQAHEEYKQVGLSEFEEQIAYYT